MWFKLAFGCFGAAAMAACAAVWGATPPKLEWVYHGTYRVRRFVHITAYPERHNFVDEIH